MPPLVSVIIPTYNRKTMLQEAVASVIGQSYRDFELIVVDDGSADGTAQDLRARFGERIRIVEQARRGVSTARNAGVRAARGGYIAFLDSDDMWLSRKLERQMAFMAAGRRRISQTDEIWIRNGLRVNPMTKHRKPSGDVFRASLELCLVSPSAVLMTRELFDDVGGFDESFAVCEDYDLWLRIARSHAIDLLAEPLVVKRGGHADQLSRSTWGFDRFRVRALKKLLDAGIEGEQRVWTIDALLRKARILAAGARKRNSESNALIYERLISEFATEEDYVQRDTSLLPAARF